MDPLKDAKHTACPQPRYQPYQMGRLFDLGPMCAVFCGDLKNFRCCCLNSVGHSKNEYNFSQIFFGRLTFSRKNGDIKDFTGPARTYVPKWNQFE